MSLARRSTSLEDELANTRGERALARLQRRDAPKFFIVNQHGDVEFSSPNLVETVLLDRARNLLAGLRKISPVIEPVYQELGQDRMLRVVPLAGELRGYLAAFIEDARGRNSLDVASERHRLTRRERDVLGFILKGLSTAGIAKSLFISEGTVGDHVKNILRKTGTNSRSELLVRVLNHDADAND